MEAEPVIGVVVERATAPVDMSEIAERYGLTHREALAVQFLVRGLTSKEIAARMGISPNTVKVFLRLAMVKTGVTTRSGIVGKFLETRLSKTASPLDA